MAQGSSEVELPEAVHDPLTHPCSRDWIHGDFLQSKIEEFSGHGPQSQSRHPPTKDGFEEEPKENNSQEYVEGAAAN